MIAIIMVTTIFIEFDSIEVIEGSIIKKERMIISTR